MKHEKLTTIASLICLLGGVAGSQAAMAEDALAQGFQAPPDEVRPAMFGFMLPGGAVSDAVITRDLEEMKAKGITACLIYTPGSGAAKVKRGGTKLVYGETENRIVTTNEFRGPGVDPEKLDGSQRPWSEEWVKTVRRAAREAGRLGMKLGVTMGGIGCELFDLPAEYGEQTLVWSSKAVNGGAPVDEVIPPKSAAQRDIAVLALPARGDVMSAQIVDLSRHLDAASRLRWNPPPGNWVIMRFAHAPSPAARCLDHLSAEALDRKWEATMGKMLAAMTPGERKGLTFVECDSYEGGKQTWTARFAGEFRQRRGYDIKPWLPVLAGRVVGDKDQSERFQRDYQLTISDLWADNHFARHTALARASGLIFHAEAAGPHQTQTDMLKSLSRCDVPMGEFWMPGTHRGVNDDRRFLLRDAAAAAHGYGMKDVFCEAFTGGNDPWRESPFHMKPCADQAFCDGLTRPCIHGYNISPWQDGTPGVVYWAGTYLNRHTTWWNQSAAFFTYLARCSYLLRQGVFAADVAIYDGDGIGRAVPRKAAAGDLAGLHDYDRVNTEILLTRMSVKDGRIVLPDGLNYRLLALDKTGPVSVAVLRKLIALVEAGATVMGTRPPGPYGLMDDPAEFTALADRLWGAGNPLEFAERSIGKGRVVWGKPLLQVLRDAGVPPDFACSGVSDKGIIDWIHRTADWGDLYFVSSRWQPVEQVKCSFRVTGKIPEFWDPVSGHIREAGAFRQENGRTTVPMRFDPFGSMFVVFRKPTTETARAGMNWWDFKPEAEVGGPWTITFDPIRGGPAAQVVFDQLTDWTQRPEDGIKYYSGMATYRTSVVVPQPAAGQRLWLDLGEVRELAVVRINGKDLGTLWTKPFRVDVTAALRSGANHLEIDVVNLWPNRLIGDTFLSAEKRYARTSMTKYTRKSQLLPSGLLGPVRILAVAKHPVTNAEKK